MPTQQQIVKKFAKKVDSLNWQSIDYQKKAFDIIDLELTQLIAAKEAAIKALYAPKTVVGDDLDALIRDITKVHYPKSKLRAAIQAYTESIASRREVEARIDELGKVQLDYGQYTAMVWEGNDRIGILERLDHLRAALTQSKEQP